MTRGSPSQRGRFARIAGSQAQTVSAHRSPLLTNDDPTRSGPWRGDEGPDPDDRPRSIAQEVYRGGVAGATASGTAQFGSRDEVSSDDDSDNEDAGPSTTLTFDIANDSDVVISKHHGGINGLLTKFTGVASLTWKPSADSAQYKTVTLIGSAKATASTKRHLCRLLGEERIREHQETSEDVQTSYKPGVPYT